MKRINHLNKRIGKLLVIEELIPNDGQNKQGFWLCKCDCGGEIKVNGTQLYSRESCGCLEKQATLDRAYTQRSYDTVTIKSEHQIHRGNAKQRGWKPLSFDEWIKIVVRPCYYCGEIDKRNRANASSYKRLRGMTLRDGDIDKYEVCINGVDRIDSLIGYEQHNVVSCCSMCNKMKNNFTVDAFIKKIEQIHSNIKNLGLAGLGKSGEAVELPPTGGAKKRQSVN